jgi:hypothetical protein
MEPSKLNVDMDVRSIASYFCTTDALNSFIDALSNTLDEFYKVNRKPIHDILGQLLPDEVLCSLSFHEYTTSNTLMDDSNLLDHLKQLHTKLKTLDVFHIKITFQPSKEFTALLYTKILSIVGNVVSIDVDYDKRILGGAVITYKGIYKDMSLFSYISSYFIKNKQYVQKLL